MARKKRRNRDADDDDEDDSDTEQAVTVKAEDDEEIDEDLYGADIGGEDGGVGKKDRKAGADDGEEKHGEQDEDENDEDGDEDESDEEGAEEDEDVDDERHKDLLSALMSDDTDEKAPASSNSKKTNGIKGDERYAHIEESEYNLLPTAEAWDAEGITLTDLVSSFSDNATYDDLKKQLSRLTSTSDSKKPLKKKRRIGDTATGPATGRGLLQEPLPKSTMQTLERVEAYKEASSEISKWHNIVQANRQAEQLKFPFDEAGKRVTTTASIISEFKPSTDLEKEVRQALSESGLGNEKEIEKEEDQEMNKLAAEEAQKRKAELARIRSLMFYHELKCKRIKKIKSKTFHKIRKKDREKTLRKAIEAGAMDDDFLREESLKAGRDRAQERMTLKHKNRSKWIRHALDKGDRNDPETREAINEQLRLGEQLKKKMDSVSDEEDEDEDGDIEGDIDLEEGDDDIEELGINKEEARRASIKGALAKVPPRLRDDMAALGDEWDDDDEEGNSLRPALRGVASKVTDEETWGTSKPIDLGLISEDQTRSFKSRTSGPITIKSSTLEEMFPIQKASAKSSASLPSVRPAPSQNNAQTRPASIDDLSSSTENPWLVSLSVREERGSGKMARTGVEGELAPSKPKAKDKKKRRNNKKNSSKDKEGKDEEGDGEEVVLTANDVVLPETERNDMIGSMDEKQAELVRRAFATTDLELDFETEKAAEIEEQLPKGEGIVVLPGWGGWGGQGTRPSRRMQQLAAQEKKRVEEQRQVALKARKDAHLKHVIINNRADKKSAKYTTPAVPWPYTSKDQYDKAMRTPIGKEWNTVDAHREMSKPKIIVKAGVMIEPIKAKSAIRQLASQRRPLGGGTLT